MVYNLGYGHSNSWCILWLKGKSARVNSRVLNCIFCSFTSAHINRGCWMNLVFSVLIVWRCGLLRFYLISSLHLLNIFHNTWLRAMWQHLEFNELQSSPTRKHLHPPIPSYYLWPEQLMVAVAIRFVLRYKCLRRFPTSLLLFFFFIQSTVRVLGHGGCGRLAYVFRNPRYAFIREMDVVFY
jgi:hypothetical protein